MTIAPPAAIIQACSFAHDGFDENPRAFNPYDANRSSGRDELPLRQDVDAPSVDRRDTRRAVRNSTPCRNVRAASAKSPLRHVVGPCAEASAKRCAQAFCGTARTVNEKQIAVSTTAVAIVSIATKKNGNPNARHTATQQRRCAENAGNAVPRHDVQFPKNAGQTGNRQRDDSPLEKPAYTCVPKNKRERADADRRPAMPCIVCISISSPKHADRQQQTADRRIGGKAREHVRPRCSSASSAARLRDAIARARRRAIGDVPSATCALHRIFGVERQNRIGTFVRRQRHVLVDHRAGDLRVVVIALRGGLKLRAQRRNDLIAGRRRRRVRFGRPIEAPGAMTMCDWPTTR